MARENWAALPQPWPPAEGGPFSCCFLLDLICLHRQCKAKGHLCVGCYKDTGDIIIVWSTVCGLTGDRDWMISSPLRMSNLEVFPRLVRLARMSSPLSPLLLTLKIELVSRSSHSGDYSEVGAQSWFGKNRDWGLGGYCKTWYEDTFYNLLCKFIISLLNAACTRKAESLTKSRSFELSSTSLWCIAYFKI